MLDIPQLSLIPYSYRNQYDRYEHVIKLKSRFNGTHLPIVTSELNVIVVELISDMDQYRSNLEAIAYTDWINNTARGRYAKYKYNSVGGARVQGALEEWTNALRTLNARAVRHKIVNKYIDECISVIVMCTHIFGSIIKKIDEDNPTAVLVPAWQYQLLIDAHGIMRSDYFKALYHNMM